MLFSFEISVSFFVYIYLFLRILDKSVTSIMIYV